MEAHEAFAVVLRTYRINRGLSQEEIAFQSGVDRTFISMLERGLRRPTINTVFKLANTLNVQPGRLIDDVEARMKQVQED